VAVDRHAPSQEKLELTAVYFVASKETNKVRRNNKTKLKSIHNGSNVSQCIFFSLIGLLFPPKGMQVYLEFFGLHKLCIYAHES
jgi:hypothetical protein